MGFDSDKYWIERGKTYREKFEAKRLHRKIPYWIQEYYIRLALEWIWRLSVTGIERILDMGCGFGRITGLLCQKFPFADIVGMDISEAQLEAAREGIPRVRFFNNSLTTVGREGWGRSRSNHLITVIEVMMHIPPDKIEAAIKTLKFALNSHGFVLTVDWWTTDTVDLSVGPDVFCWVHPYEELFEAQGFELFSEKKIPFVRQKLRIWRLNK